MQQRCLSAVSEAFQLPWNAAILENIDKGKNQNKNLRVINFFKKKFFLIFLSDCVQSGFKWKVATSTASKVFQPWNAVILENIAKRKIIKIYKKHYYFFLKKKKCKIFCPIVSTQFILKLQVAIFKASKECQLSWNAAILENISKGIF